MAKMQPQTTETSKIDALYKWLSYDLQRMKGEILNEMKLSSVQVGSLYKDLKADKQESAAAITQEIRFSYKQNQTIYDGLAAMISSSDVGTALEEIKVKLEMLDALNDVRTLDENIGVVLADDVLPKLEALEELLVKVDEALALLDEKLGDGYEKLAESVTENSEKILGAVAAIEIPVAESFDYDRIANDVDEKVNGAVAGLNESLANLSEAVAGLGEEKPQPTVTIDYEKIINGSAEKVVEALPYPEKVDYRRITDIAEKAAALAVEKALAALNVEALAEQLAEKIAPPVVNVPEIDYDRLADLVVAKMAANSETNYEVVLDDDGIEAIAKSVSEKIEVSEVDYQPVDYDRISEIVEDKLSDETEPTYDLVIDAEGIEAIAKSVSEKICDLCQTCEELGVADATEEVEEAPVEEAAEEVVEEAVAEVVEAEPAAEAEAVEQTEEVVEETVVEEVAEAPVEETTEEVAEAVVEEVAEAPVEETTEEVVEEAIEEDVPSAADEAVEEPVDLEARAAEEAEARKEIAIAVVPEYREVDNQLVDAETGLVIRLKRSFTAKMRQSDEKVKGYYSDIKNELTSYKKINSNVSWHGDRFNFGRDTVAKINICGKTLCFYLALDPNDPEYKTTVYHQKDVGEQKAYESTPFMVKIKSDAAAKKALRLVGFLAEKVGTEKDESFEAVDYVDEFRYQSTKQLFEDGFIKVTKEKKVDLDF